jgi:hypothetical protein
MVNRKLRVKSKRGGKRKGAGRKSMGKRTISLSLKGDNLDKARERGVTNMSELFDGLLAGWLG